ncbi:MAG TPA: SDR family oxidoreductase [Stellaceae bacterium]|jgi:NAD(P)-dependent dehydrogenase (short-subunit alcohol dehydrogenase family)|nr:SDR family oxidoreductase [Stellaceae bacterium]
MDLQLAGRTALITGASKGIGLAVAQAFAAEGVNLILAARSKDQLEKNAADLKDQYKIKVDIMALDLSDQAARDKLVAAHPNVDILINNAGAIPGGTIFEVDDKAWRAGWDLKVYGYVNLTRAYFKNMAERKKGVIICICGLGGEKVEFGYIAGAAGNASLMAFARAMGGRSPDYGVRVLAVNPGPVLTDRTVYLGKIRAKRELGDESRYKESFKHMPFGRPATVEEVAPMVVFLASDLANYVSGTVITIDGGIANRHSNP